MGAIASLDTLRCFVAAARALNFRQAARSVALGPTAFSQRIKALEEQLGRQLFSRATRSVTLTSALDIDGDSWRQRNQPDPNAPAVAPQRKKKRRAA